MAMLWVDLRILELELINSSKKSMKDLKILYAMSIFGHVIKYEK
jgi:hypothetical protein